MEFNVGDRVRLLSTDVEATRGGIPLGSTGVVVAHHGSLTLIAWDHVVPLAYNARDRLHKNCSDTPVWGVHKKSLDFEDSKVTPVERKIRVMESRWKTFQQRKQQCAA